ncbi:hypothetical protein CSC15_2513 [Escherichia coli]|nr:hypothetical protein CSC15_2513 [Escherichia coli]
MRRKRLIRPTKITPNQAIALSDVGLIRHVSIASDIDAGCGVMNCTPNVGHNLTSEGAVYETFI